MIEKGEIAHKGALVSLLVSGKEFVCRLRTVRQSLEDLAFSSAQSTLDLGKLFEVSEERRVEKWQGIDFAAEHALNRGWVRITDRGPRVASEDQLLVVDGHTLREERLELV